MYCSSELIVPGTSSDGKRKSFMFVTLLELFCATLVQTSFLNSGQNVIFLNYRTIGRFFLLHQYSESIIRSPPIQLLNRKTIGQESQAKQASNDLPNGTNTVSFKLKRSGRVIRKVEGAPPLHYRNWKSLENDETPKDNAAILLKAEVLYVAKPLIHLLSMGVFGRRSWKSFSIALALDLISIRTYYKNQQLMTKDQKVELSRRCVNLMLFLVRSPFYENISKQRLEGIFESLGNKIPFAKSICNPIIEYIPQWQNTYFYMWST